MKYLLLIASFATVAGCASVLGFEDKEPYPASDGGGGTGGNVAGGGMGGDAGGGGAGGSGGEPGVDVLLIADRLEDAIGMYDPMNGTYLGDFVPPLTGSEPYTMSSPNNAAQGPDGRIYVSDQLTDSILRFEADGSFESVFADQTDGLDNVRGMDWRDDLLYVAIAPSSDPDAIATFDMNGVRQPDFVTDQGSCFDVLFLPTRTMMFADIDLDQVRLYDVDASSSTVLLSVNFPQQIQPLDNGNFVVGTWDSVVEFKADGGTLRTLLFSGATRGVYPLDNGEWLISWDDGVEAYNPNSGQLSAQVRVGAGFTKIERVTLPALP
jgi:hypothetical protein